MRGLMISVAVVAIVFSAATRLDIPSVAKHAFWREGYPKKKAILYQISPAQTYTTDTFPPDYAWRPKLAYWVIPVLTSFLIWPSKNKRAVQCGIAAIGLISLSWLSLRRFMHTIIVNHTWPDYHMRCIYHYITWGNDLSYMFGDSLKTCDWYILFPPYAYLTMYMSADQMANLSCLVVLLITLVARLRHPVSRRLIAMISLPPNVYTLMEWTLQMRSARSWGFRNTPFTGHPSEVIPNASGMEIVGGLMLIAMTAYLLFVLVGAPAIAAGFSARGSFAWFGAERFPAEVRRRSCT
jgi:hypothetical protein